MNCEQKIFSEVVFERILDEMALLVKNSEAESENRRRAFQFIRAWGQSQNLNYLPVFQQTYMVIINSLSLICLYGHCSKKWV